MTEFERVNIEHERLKTLIHICRTAGIDPAKILNDAIQANKQEGTK